MNPSKNKRQVDFHAITQWVGKGERVLDLGCGRVLLEYLKQKSVYGLGSILISKILSCIKRVSAYQGDIKSFLNQFLITALIM